MNWFIVLAGALGKTPHPGPLPVGEGAKRRHSARWDAQFLSLAHPFIPPLRNSEPGKGVDTMRAPTIPVRTLTRTLPKPIGAVLGRLDRHVRASALVRGVGTTAAVVSLVIALGMTADFLWALPQALRWGSWGAASWRF